MVVQLPSTIDIFGTRQETRDAHLERHRLFAVVIADTFGTTRGFLCRTNMCFIHVDETHRAIDRGDKRNKRVPRKKIQPIAAAVDTPRSVDSLVYSSLQQQWM